MPEISGMENGSSINHRLGLIVHGNSSKRRNLPRTILALITETSVVDKSCLILLKHHMYMSMIKFALHQVLSLFNYILSVDNFIVYNNLILAF